MRKIVRPIGALAFACVLSACATAAQQKAAAIIQNTKLAATSLKECTAAVYHDPQYAPLLIHAPENVRNATLQQLADKHFASDDEVSLLFAIHPRLKECRDNGVDQLARTTPTLVPILTESMMQQENTLVALIRKEITWGDYLRKNRDLASETTVKTTDEIKRIAAGLDRDNRDEIAERTEAISAIARLVQTEQAIAAMQRPRTTNCVVASNDVRCVTR